MRRNAVRWSLATLFVASSGSGAEAASTHAERNVPVAQYRVSWVYRTHSLREMVRTADAIVVATFTRALPGRTALSSNGESFVGFELNEFQVDETIKVDRSLEATVTVERTSHHGAAGAPPIALNAPDGPYDPEVRYLLFLKRQPETDHFMVVNEQARYWIGPEQRVRPHARGSVDGAVSRALRGRRLATVRALVRTHIP